MEIQSTSETWNSDSSHQEDPEKKAWLWSGFDATGLLVAAFFAIVVEGFFIGPTWPFAVEISIGILAGVIVILVLTRRFSKSKRVSLSRTVYRGASWAVGLLAGIEVKLVLAMSWPAGVVSTVILLAVVTWVVRQQRFARKRLRQSAATTIVVESTTPASEGWFRREDIIQVQRPWLAFEAVYGGLVGFAASGLILLYIVLRYTVLIPLFVPGVLGATFLLASVGLLRNRIVRYVAARGFKTAFVFRNAVFGFYLAAVVSAALGLGFYYGYVVPQSTSLVLPFAGLFVLFLYLYLLLGRVIVRSQEGRLCIFQFLAQYSQNGGGYYWLRRGLNTFETRLQVLGVSIKRNRLYFGACYSLFEGSDVETDLDKLYLLGDWSSQPRESHSVHDVVGWFLSRTAIANVEGFSGTTSFGDTILQILGALARNLPTEIANAPELVTILLAFIRLLQYLLSSH